MMTFMTIGPHFDVASIHYTPVNDEAVFDKVKERDTVVNRFSFDLTPDEKIVIFDNLDFDPMDASTWKFYIGSKAPCPSYIFRRLASEEFFWSDPNASKYFHRISCLMGFSHTVFFTA